VLSADSRISTMFSYYPRSVADPPSSLRQQAYSEGSPLPGPDIDPEGWKVLPSTIVQGKLFGTRHAELECTLALAAPCKYAIGTPLPLMLTLSSSDKEALDLLSTAASVRVFLVRSIVVGKHALDPEHVHRDHQSEEVFGRAYFWPLDKRAEGKKRLQGEIDIPSNLKPSFCVPRFNVEYTIKLLPLEAPGFVPSEHRNEPLLTEEITIVTSNAHGIVPRSYAPPNHETLEEDSYIHTEENSMGMPLKADTEGDVNW